MMSFYFSDLLIKEFQKNTNPRSSKIPYPDNWSLVETSEKPYELIELDDESREYADVIANVTKSDGERFENCIAKVGGTMHFSNHFAYSLFA